MVWVFKCYNRHLVFHFCAKFAYFSFLHHIEKCYNLGATLMVENKLFTKLGQETWLAIRFGNRIKPTISFQQQIEAK